MVVVFSSTGFFIHDCDESAFDTQLESSANSNYPTMPNKNLVGWMFCKSASLDLIVESGIETCYIDQDGNVKNYMKRNLSDCACLIRGMLAESNIKEEKHHK